MLYTIFDKILLDELKPALGCTEPIALAYAAAVAKATLDDFPQKVIIECSGNIIKNVMGVTVPNSKGMKGIEAACLLGIVGGDANKVLEVLSEINDDHISKTKELLQTNICEVILKEGIAGLYISITLIKDNNSSQAVILNCHNEITQLYKNGKLIQNNEVLLSENKDLREHLSLEAILDYAENADLTKVKDVILEQINLNVAIAEEGLKNNWGLNVGSTLLKYNKNDVKTRAKALASAGSDARMAGCSLPVVINSGSGNQGMTVSLPVYEYAKELKVSEEEMIKALVVSNLVAIHQKRFIGSLSAYCGAVSAAAAASAAITYLHTKDINTIAAAITNTLAIAGGIVCDGAKASCAGKIAASLDSAILGYELAYGEGLAAESGDGLVKDTIEKTIRTFGKVGKDGMKETDIEILNLMIK